MKLHEGEFKIGYQDDNYMMGKLKNLVRAWPAMKEALEEGGQKVNATNVDFGERAALPELGDFTGNARLARHWGG